MWREKSFIIIVRDGYEKVESIEREKKRERENGKKREQESGRERESSVY